MVLSPSRCTAVSTAAAAGSATTPIGPSVLALTSRDVSITLQELRDSGTGLPVDDETDPTSPFYFLIHHAISNETATPRSSFAYCRLKSEADPYALEIIDTKPLAFPYATISDSGITYLRSSIESEFVRFDQWIREYILFRRLFAVKFVSNYVSLKHFLAWKSATRRSVFHKAAEDLQDSLFTLRPDLLVTIMQLRKMCTRLEVCDEDFQLISSKGNATLTLDEYCEAQASHLAARSRVLKLHTKATVEVIASGCRSMLRETLLSNIRSANSTTSELEQSSFSEQARARKIGRRMQNFVRMSDFLFTRSLVCLAIRGLGQALDLIGNKSVFSSAIALAPDGNILASPTKDAFESSFLQVLTEMNEVAGSIPLFSDADVLNQFMRDREGGDKPADRGVRELLQIHPDCPRLQAEIRNRISLQFQKLREHAASFAKWGAIFRECHRLIEADHDGASPSWFQDRLVDVRKWQTDLETPRHKTDVGMFVVDCSGAAGQLRPLITRAKECLLHIIPSVARFKTNTFLVKMRVIVSRMEKRPTSVEDLTDYLTFCAGTIATGPAIEEEFDYIRDIYQVIEAEPEVEVAADDTAAVYSAAFPQMRRFREITAEFNETKEQLLAVFGRNIDGSLDDVRRKAESVLGAAGHAMFRDEKSDVEVCIEKITSLADEARQLQLDEQRLVGYQREFGLGQTPVDEVGETVDFLRSLSTLWVGIRDWQQFVAEIGPQFVHRVDVKRCVEQLKSSLKALKQAQGKVVFFGAFKWLTTSVDEYKPYITIFEAVRSEHLLTHHWKKIDEICKPLLGGNLSERGDWRIELLLYKKLGEVADAIHLVHVAASREAHLETELSAIQSLWTGGAKRQGIEVATKAFGDSRDMFILGSNIDDVLAALAESRTSVNTLLSSKYCEGLVKTRCEKLERGLTIVAQVLGLWVIVQRSWLYLESIFSLPEIARQWPADEASFRRVDKFFRELMKPLGGGFNAYLVAGNANLIPQFHDAEAALDEVHQSLELKLEAKRQSFPRFYFISNDDLVDFICQARQPEKLQPHIPKLFDGVASLDLLPFGELAGIIGAAQENIKLLKPLRARGDVEKWLLQLEGGIVDTLRDDLEKALPKLVKMKKSRWPTDHASQTLLAVDMLLWRHKVEEAITSLDLRAAETYVLESISQLADRIQHPKTTTVEKITFSSMLTLEVHMRDVAREMVLCGVDNVSDFIWQRQLRMELDTEKGLRLKQGPYTLPVGFEYVGVQPRLVITSVTDRIYLTIVSALAMGLGTAPAGPAGTGKTETVKDLAKHASRLCVVFNCGEGVTYRMTERLFMGVAQSGAWVCLDEFNRINVEVLSVIASQLGDIRQAIATRKQTFSMSGGDALRLTPTCGFFVTMNPTYLGRTELPDNLKSLFRPVAVTAPDMTQIAQVMLFSCGFAAADGLATKVTALFQRCAYQLSRQDHYDFGLRTVKTLLTEVDALKRREGTSVTEEYLMYMALHHGMMPKLAAEDRDLFQELLSDYFPLEAARASRLPEKHDMTIVDAAHRHHHLSIHHPQLEKAAGLLGVISSRFGIGIIGASLSGKSTILSLAASARNGRAARDDITKLHLVNPRAISYTQLFGSYNATTQSWTDGILSAAVAAALDTSKNEAILATQTDRPSGGGGLTSVSHWIVLDGPVDTTWVESLNSVLDDSRLLCLDSGVRMKLPSTMRFVIETDSLSNASPATVSRLGIVHLDLERDTSHLSLLKAWTAAISASRSSGEAQAVQTLTEDFFGRVLPAAVRLSRPGHVTSPVHIMMRYLQLAKPLLVELSQSSSHAAEGGGWWKDGMEMALTFAAIHSMSPIVDDENLDQFDALVRRVTQSLPPFGTVLEYKPLISAHRWVRWDESEDLQKVTMRPPPDSSVPRALRDVLLPTAEFGCLLHFVHFCANEGIPLLVRGEHGVGKSRLVTAAMRELDASQFNTVTVPICHSSPASCVSDVLDTHLRFKSTTGDSVKSSTGRLLLFVDDINMAPADQFGTQPALELLRQLVDAKVYVDSAKCVAKHVAGLSYVATTCGACGVRTAATPGG